MNNISLRRALLRWYDRHQRVLPWRATKGQLADPYHVWLSEIMLQQTTVATVGPYFLRFLERWPTIDVLASAPLDDVLHAWQGLGYYARARNLHRCAQQVSGELAGVFPDTEEELLKLPGIGAYTAAAIAAIAFNRPANVVDGNIERVVARLIAITDPMPGVKQNLRDEAAKLAPKTSRGRPGDFAQGLMDLGATICTPRNPACFLCPLATQCRAFALGIAEDLPKRAPKKQKPTRRGVVFWITVPDGSVFIRRRAEKGLLGGMMEFPSTEWSEGETVPTLETTAPIDCDWQELPGIVRHTFTHFHLELTVWTGRAKAAEFDETMGILCSPEQFGDYALPTLMKKVAKHAFSHM